MIARRFVCIAALCATVLATGHISAAQADTVASSAPSTAQPTSIPNDDADFKASESGLVRSVLRVDGPALAALAPEVSGVNPGASSFLYHPTGAIYFPAQTSDSSVDGTMVAYQQAIVGAISRLQSPSAPAAVQASPILTGLEKQALGIFLNSSSASTITSMISLLSAPATLADMEARASALSGSVSMSRYVSGGVADVTLLPSLLPDDTLLLATTLATLGAITPSQTARTCDLGEGEESYALCLVDNYVDTLGPNFAICNDEDTPAVCAEIDAIVELEEEKGSDAVGEGIEIAEEMADDHDGDCAQEVDMFEMSSDRGVDGMVVGATGNVECEVAETYITSQVSLQNVDDGPGQDGNTNYSFCENQSTCSSTTTTIYVYFENTFEGVATDEVTSKLTGEQFSDPPAVGAFTTCC